MSWRGSLKQPAAHRREVHVTGVCWRWHSCEWKCRESSRLELQYDLKAETLQCQRILMLRSHGCINSKESLGAELLVERVCNGGVAAVLVLLLIEAKTPKCDGMRREFPTVETFIEEEAEKFDGLEVEYRFGAAPRLMLRGDKGQKETLRIDR